MIYNHTELYRLHVAIMTAGWGFEGNGFGVSEDFAQGGVWDSPAEGPRGGSARRGAWEGGGREGGVDWGRDTPKRLYKAPKRLYKHISVRQKPKTLNEYQKINKSNNKYQFSI